MDFDPSKLGGLGGLLGGLQQRVSDMKDKAAAARHTGESGGGLVKVTLSGDYKIHGVEIAAGALEDRELLEDMVRAAVGDALRQAADGVKAGMAEATGGLPIPPGLLPF